MRDLRCPSKLHALYDLEAGEVEVKCSSRRCGATQDVVVLHRFDAASGDFLRTVRYRQPRTQ